MTHQTACLAAFKTDIKRFVGTKPTTHNLVEAGRVVDYYTGQLQLGDLTLSQQDARDILREAYKEISA